MPGSRLIFSVGLLLLAVALPARAQNAAVVSDSARWQIRSVLRSYYRNLASGNWDALAADVLSPKLLERRGAPENLPNVIRDRSRGSTVPPAVAAPSCPSKASPMIDDAAIRLEGDWAEVSVPRCSGRSGGVDEFGMIYFEQRWRFIYTNLYESPSAPETAQLKH